MASFCVTLFDTIENPAEGDNCFLTTEKNLTINKGSSYRIKYQISKDSNSVNLTGYTLRGQIKTSASSPDVLLNMTSANLLLKVNNDSSFSMTLPESFTRRVQGSFAIYEIELINPLAEAYKIVKGLITFLPEATL